MSPWTSFNTGHRIYTRTDWFRAAFRRFVFRQSVPKWPEWPLKFKDSDGPQCVVQQRLLQSLLKATSWHVSFNYCVQIIWLVSTQSRWQKKKECGHRYVARDQAHHINHHVCSAQRSQALNVTDWGQWVGTLSDGIKYAREPQRIGVFN